MNKAKVTRIDPSRAKYVFAGFKYANFEVTQSYEYGDVRREYTSEQHIIKSDAGGFLLGKDINPTRELSEALVIELEEPEKYSYGTSNRATIYLNGLYLSLYPIDKAEDFLLNHPLPRKAPKKSEREAVYRMFDGKCAYCGRDIPYERMQVDHKVPHMSKGGKDELENYLPACDVCNRVKSSNDVEQFRESIRNCARIHHGRKESERHIYADSDKIAEYYGLLGQDWKEKPIEFYFEKGEKKCNSSKR